MRADRALARGPSSLLTLIPLAGGDRGWNVTSINVPIAAQESILARHQFSRLLNPC
jgi:hypothetical protein